jgi:ABC-type phosphate transport system substrate-binding protein
VTNGKPTGRTKEFIDFLTSADGQKIISSTGFLALPISKN